jgi:hypothetical protein
MPTTPKKRYCSTGTCRHAYCKGLREGVDKGFRQGIGYAVAEVIRSHDNPTIAVDLAGAAGYDYNDFKNAGVDEYDLKTLRKFRGRKGHLEC